MIRRPKPRRGIIILIVLSLLVLFVLLVVTFAIVAGQFRRAAMAYARQETLGQHPTKDLDRVFYDLLRDTRARNSVVRFHSLLRDFYGEDGFSGRLAPGYHQSFMNDASPGVPFPNPNNATLPAASSRTQARVYSGGQFFDLVAYVPLNGPFNLTSTDGQAYTISQIPGYYNGCVLTVTSGEAQGISMRIVGYAYLNGLPVFRVLAPKGNRGQQITPAALGGSGGARFVVNGRPFNGAGFGYQTPSAPGEPTKVDYEQITVTANQAAVTLPQDARPVPNHAGRPVVHASMQPDFLRLLGGGTDEGYDAPDNQNLALGLVMAGATDSGGVIPSFHRPGLVNYWINETSLGYWAADDDFKRHVLMRPLEPNFDGSNPSYNPATAPGTPSWYVTGPWDVDNDGDGIEDSIWVDFGLPVQTARDGRKYKPLFAVLCIDLDGRLNVNAHGRLTVAGSPQPVGLAGGILTQPPPGPPAPAYSALPKGLGYGPPEVALPGLTGLMSARYGPDGHPGRPGLDLLARLKFFEEPENYFRSDPVNGTGPRSSYSSWSDLRAELAFGLNSFGQPVSEELPPGLADTRNDSHYEMNLIEPDGTDDPFTVGDLEQVLRRYDYDVSMLSDRLSNYFTNLTSSTSENARIMTTASFDAPVPGVAVPAELAEALRNAQQNQTAFTPFNPLYKGAHLKASASFVDLLSVRLLTGGVPAAKLSMELGKMVAPDVRMGLRMDLNRPLGNGRDRSGAGANGVCDEFGEQNGEQIYSDAGATRAEFQNVPMWHANGTDVNGDRTPPYSATADPNPVLDKILARQLLARHLYVMMMTLIDHGSVGTPDPTTDANGKMIADHIAQWAVNVVDFRDADSIMTVFEYDRNPFNGWNADGATGERIDGDPTTVETGAERGVAWGCERPELLLTEANGFHARRTTDSPTDNGGNDAVSAGDDYDQDYLPFASAFVELYNPWSGADTTNTFNSGKTPPRELYGSSAGVRLNATTPSGHGVWRLIVVNETTSGAAIQGNSIDPDDANADWTANPANRAVYFISDPANLPAVGSRHGQRQYFTNQPVNPILPGQFAVIGGGYQTGNTWVSPMGDVTASAASNDLQRIVLNPNASVVQYYPGNGAPVQAAQAVALVPNLSRSTGGVGRIDYIGTSFNVSEPTAGYPIVSGGSQFDADNQGGPPVDFNYTGRYEDAAAPGSTLPEDDPLDKDDGEFLNEVASTDGTRRTFARIYLQRLANPMADFNPLGNPYRTLDSIPMDLTVFNGRADFPDDATDPDISNTPGLDFRCLQRGDADNRALVNEERRLWSQEPARTAAPPAAGAGTLPPDFYFRHRLTHTLGAVNTKYRPPSVMPVNLTYPWLVWNNRPYVSQYELMQVPKTSSWDLLKNFTLPDGSSPYDGTPSYTHLVNFFHTDSTTIPAQHIYRIFDYVHIPSRFVGTETMLNPNYFGKSVNFPQPNGISNGLLPPFNRISAYREPGRINLNTLTSPTVLTALPGGRNPMFTTFVDSVWSASGGTPTLDPSIPSYCARPFRPASSPLRPHETSPPPFEIESTLLRNAASTQYPLLEDADTSARPDLVARHPRNSYFRYDNFNKFGNTVTSRSNVYAIWITVGYFEVEPNWNAATGSVDYDAFHPDGFRVAQEIGIDTGEIRRHRAFYIVDRTIPVAFEPGENHNVDKCVLLRRFIE